MRPEQSAWISEPSLFLLALAGLGTAGLELVKNCTSPDSHQKKKTHQKVNLRKVNPHLSCEQFSPGGHLATKPNSHVPAGHAALSHPRRPPRTARKRSVRQGRPRSRTPGAAARNKGLARGKEKPKREQIPHSGPNPLPQKTRGGPPKHAAVRRPRPALGRTKRAARAAPAGPARIQEGPLARPRTHRRQRLVTATGTAREAEERTW